LLLRRSKMQAHDEHATCSEDTTAPPQRHVTTTSGPRVLTATILFHRDTGRIGERSEWDGSRPMRAQLSRLDPLFHDPRLAERPARPLDEPRVSRDPVQLELTGVGALVLQPARRGPPVSIDGEPLTSRRAIDPGSLERGVLLALGEAALLLVQVSERPPPCLRTFGLIGNSVAIMRVRHQLARVSAYETPVLIRGASGTGKELVAHAIHSHSRRRDRPLLAVNMAAIAPTIAASALFGHVRGAFTGALFENEGYFRRAHGGTLFLDEIADTPASVQPALLRALESGEVQPVGSASARAVDVRIIAATDVDLEAAVEAERFRMQLLTRLAGYELTIPALTERRDDIPRLLLHFLRSQLRGLQRAERLEPKSGERPWLPFWLVDAAVRQPWIGNVRQLQNVARQLALELADSTEIPRTPAVLRLLSGKTAPAHQPQTLTKEARTA
jgi:transcriptional regulator of aromatic amino acid metabolism